MPARSRSRIAWSHSGERILGGALHIPATVEGYKFSSDIIGSYGLDHNFDITTSGGACLLLNGNDGGNFDYLNFPRSTAGYVDIPEVDTVTLGTHLLASTNPSKAHVQVPVFFAEMRDLPRLVQTAGRTILGSAGNKFLAFQFGWKPLLSDIKKMLDFHDASEKRFKAFKQIRDSGGLRRQARGPSAQAETTSTLFLSPSGTWTTHVSGTRTTWGSVRWVPNALHPLPVSDPELASKARGQVLGLAAGQIVSNAWEALPWSWLADWFSNVGDMISLLDNSVAVPMGGHYCIMQKLSFSVSGAGSGLPGTLTGSQTNPAIDWKFRTVSSGFSPFVASLPILTGRQFAILGAISNQRMDAYRGYRR